MFVAVVRGSIVAAFASDEHSVHDSTYCLNRVCTPSLCVFFVAQKQMMKGRYNIHRQTATQSRAIHSKFKGQVDFKGGAYGILKGAMMRDLEMEGGGTERSDESSELQQMRTEIDLLERKNKAREHELDLMEREQALRAKTGGALQSQVK